MKVRRQSVMAGLVLLGVFLLGAMGGIITAGILAHRHLHALFDGTPEEVDTRVTLALLEPVLRLSGDERQRVRGILERNAVEHTRLRETIEPGLASLRLKEREEIRAVFTPDKRARLDRVLDHIDARRGRVERFLDH